MYRIAQLDLEAGIAVTTIEGVVFPIVTMFDRFDDETDEPEEAAVCLIRASHGYVTVKVPPKETVH